MLQAISPVYNVIAHASCSYDQAALWRELLDLVESLEDHSMLQSALIDNVWNSHGDTTL